MATSRNLIVRLRLTQMEKEAWGKAAGGQGKLSEWIRAQCNANALSFDLLLSAGATPVVDNQAHREARPLPATQAPGGASSLSERDSGAQGRSVTSPVPSTQCARWNHHRPGTYCGTCHKVQ